MKCLTNYEELDNFAKPFQNLTEDVLMSSTGESEFLEGGSLSKRVSDNLSTKGILLTRIDCLPDPELPSGLKDDERKLVISKHYALVKAWFLITWLNMVNSADLATDLEVKVRKAATADEINDAIQKLSNEFPFVSDHLSVITAMRVRALSLNPFQESIGITPEFNQIHIDFKILTAQHRLLSNSLKEDAIKNGSYSKSFGKELVNTFRKRICYNWNYVSALYDIKLSDFNLRQMSLLMRLSGYKGSVRATKASKKELKDVVFPTIMTFILKYVQDNVNLWKKPFLTKGLSRDSQIISKNELDNMSFDQLGKLTLHDFITGDDLIKIVINKHNESGFAKQDDKA